MLPDAHNHAVQLAHHGLTFARAPGLLRVLVICEARMLREGIASLLANARVSTRQCDPDELSEIVDDGWAPDVVLVGPGRMIRLYPHTREAARLHPDAPIAAIVPEADSATFDLAAREHLAGLMDVSVGARELDSAVHRLARGQRVFPATVIDTGAAAARRLSQRQREILALLSTGASNRQIADQLMISINTVKFHVRSIFSELHVSKRVEAANLWRSMTPDALD